MVDFDAIKEAAAKKMEEAVYDSVRDLTLALMQDDEFCRPLENMERRDSAKCKLAMHVIFEYLRQATALMAKDVWNVMEVVANLSVWPETKDEVKPEEALERLKSLYDAARTIRAGRNDVNFLFQGMIEDLMDLEQLG